MEPTHGEHGHSRREALEVLNALQPPHSADAPLWISPSRRCISAASIYIATYVAAVLGSVTVGE